MKETESCHKAESQGQFFIQLRSVPKLWSQTCFHCGHASYRLLYRQGNHNVKSPFYTSKVIQFQFGFNPHWTGFIPSRSNPVPIKLVSNQFESIHLVMWIQSGSKWIGDEAGDESCDSSTSHTTCCVWRRNVGFGVKKWRNKCFDNCLGRRPGPNRYQWMQVEQSCSYEDSGGKWLIGKRLWCVFGGVTHDSYLASSYNTENIHPR